MNYKVMISYGQQSNAGMETYWFNRKPTAEEQEEWLMQYDPLIPDDPKHVLSHKYQVRDHLDK